MYTDTVKELSGYPVYRTVHLRVSFLEGGLSAGRDLGGEDEHKTMMFVPVTPGLPRTGCQAPGGQGGSKEK
jgi:hypothetical protein